MQGYVQFAEDYYRSHMATAFAGTANALDGDVFALLGWQLFYGKIGDYRALKGKILDSSGQPLTHYQGMDGYARFAEDHYESSMTKAFLNVSAVLDEGSFKSLGWQEFHGNPQEYHSLRGKILDAEGGPFGQYMGMEGYIRFAEEHYGSDLTKAFKNVSAVLNKHTFKRLSWQSFQGSIEDYRSLRKRIIGADGQVFAHYQGMDGYAKLAEEHYGTNMAKTFMNVSATLDKRTFQQLGWKAFHGKAQDYHNLRGKIVDVDGQPLERYLGIDGYIAFAKEHYGSNMMKAFVNVSAVLDRNVFRRLGWQLFHGTVEDFLGTRNIVLDVHGNIRPQYKDMEGYARLAEESYGSNMQKTFRSVSATLNNLNKRIFRQLGWQVFVGTVEDYRSLKVRFWTPTVSLSSAIWAWRGWRSLPRSTTTRICSGLSPVSLHSWAEKRKWIDWNSDGRPSPEALPSTTA